MKNIQNIAIATIIVFFSVSCKKEASVETKEVTKAKTEIAAKNLETAKNVGRSVIFRNDQERSRTLDGQGCWLV